MKNLGPSSANQMTVSKLTKLVIQQLEESETLKKVDEKKLDNGAIYVG